MVGCPAADAPGTCLYIANLVHALTRSARLLGSGLLREPLLQFLGVGFAIYLGFAWFTPNRELERDSVAATSARSNELPRRIFVEREALLAFVQLRTRQPDALATARAFDGESPEQRKIWVDRFVREEALVREAKLLGLDRDDELIRRRLVQKLEFLTLGLVEDQVAISQGDFEAFYRARVEEYRVPSLLTFAHIFVRGASDSAPPSEAVELLEELNTAGVGFSESLSLGDRFLYNRHYVDRTLDEVRSHFGIAMAETLLGLDPDAALWQGPIASDHGWHLVMLSDRAPSRLPTIGEIKASLRQDLERERAERALEAGLGAIVSRYRVDLGPGLAGGESLPSAP